ncbi:L-2-amino-thiazoline-4-carboxylic acid hydrolase [Salirhabdus salicampi]|uniref:L-2-amino-thiazoline-4-carboxylic acid hydrolase n=1 Tax=Salirhabdus salicampi TaxID=476102 RepID=UPI0020C2232F|nr:L-2-amino-thiazoline-4-carboxylic acid hydrolase [Salirhabdus salicampi]MCP8616175.1 L-2-amino-thiazoline-4-carboxylic acid hydrolase [Salirhabdus salicampi]
MTEERKPIPPLSMYQITAMLFSHLEKSITTSFGDKGKNLIRLGLKRFGYEDAYRIAIQAKKEGEEHRLFDYIPEDRTEIRHHDVTIYGQMAKMFAQITKAIVDEFGDEGQNAIREGVRTFGETRGKGIATRASHLGKRNTIDHYLSNYDMGRSELFEFETLFKENVIEQTFTKCPFGQQWADDDMHEYGILYCEMIDPSIAKGYNPNFEVEHDKYVLKEGVCHFNFKLEDK